MMRKFNFLFFVFSVSLSFMNLMMSCTGGEGGSGSEKVDGSEHIELSISNDSLAYIYGELVGEGYHNEYINFKYHEENVDLSKIKERFDKVNRLCSNKGFLDGLVVYFLTQSYCQMLYEEFDFDINPSELRQTALKFIEDSTNFISREEISARKNYLVDRINNNDTASIYEFFGGYTAYSITKMMKKENNIFADCKNEIYKGISYSEEMEVKQPAIDAFCDYIAIEVAMNIWSMALEASFSPQIAANAFENTIIDGVVKSRTEKEQLLEKSFEIKLELLEAIDRVTNGL